MPYKDAEKRKAYKKNWKMMNPDKVAGYRKSWAKENKEYFSNYASKNKEKLTNYKAQWYKNNAERISKMKKIKDSESVEARLSRILIRRKSRAKINGVEFSISIKDIEIPEFCPLLGVRLEFSGKPNNPNGISIDRIDPQKGYIKGNVWVVSYRANRIKNDATVLELEQITFRLREKLGHG